jgi:hypothetical protein
MNWKMVSRRETAHPTSERHTLHCVAEKYSGGLASGYFLIRQQPSAPATSRANYTTTSGVKEMAGLNLECMVRQDSDFEKWPKVGANFDRTAAKSAAPHHMKFGELFGAFATRFILMVPARSASSAYDTVAC